MIHTHKTYSYYVVQSLHSRAPTIDSHCATFLSFHNISLTSCQQRIQSPSSEVLCGVLFSFAFALYATTTTKLTGCIHFHDRGFHHPISDPHFLSAQSFDCICTVASLCSCLLIFFLMRCLFLLCFHAYSLASGGCAPSLGRT
jgi:hypothetical protein